MGLPQVRLVSVHRLAHYRADDPYTRVPNTAVNDPALDLKARGLLLLMLSKPDGWRFNERNLAREAGVSRDQIRTSLQKLQEAGYVERGWEKGADGTPEHVTRVYDVPAGRESIPELVGNAGGRESRPYQELRESNTKSKRPSSPRQPDLLFEALVKASGMRLDGLTRTERGRVNAAAKQLREVGATPEQVWGAASKYMLKFPGAAITANAIAAHWSSIAPAPPEQTCSRCRAPLTAHDDYFCQEAYG